MAIKIVNIAKHLLIVTLNSGDTIYLGPGESSNLIEEIEITGNEKVTKLLKSNMISVSKVATGKKIEKEAKKHREKQRRRKTKKKPERKLSNEFEGELEKESERTEGKKPKEESRKPTTEKSVKISRKK